MNVRQGVVGILVATLVWTVGPAAVGVAASAEAPGPACVDVAASQAQALAVAAACGRQVAVESSRTEFTQVLANPGGRLTFESAVVPQRTRRADGSWVDVDLNLRHGTDGLLRPGASVADVRFSPGGSHPLVTLVRGDRSLTLSWPGRLPAPVISGAEATYPAVLPGVDLAVRATRTGFTHLLVVKSPQAATQPALRRVRFDLGGDATVTRAPDGSLRAVAGATLVASAQPAAMWDSSADAGAAATDVSGARSSTGGPGDRAHLAAVGTELTADRGLVLVPDRTLLTAAPAYPVFVDPAWSTGKTKWAYATSNGSNNTDYTVARVGKSPDTGVLYRSFFEFPTTANNISLKGKHIQSAYVQMKLDHSWSCADTWTHMYLTPVINATMRASWSLMTLTTWLSSTAGHANEAGGCSTAQPDMIMNFDDTGVTQQVQTAATKNWNTITVGFCACNSAGQYETNQDRWKKFFPNDAKLIVDYDSIPDAPTGLQVAGVACTTAAISIGTATPALSAVYPDADTGQTLSGAYEWIEWPANGVVTDTVPTRKTPPPPASAPAGDRGTTAALSTLTANKVYAYRVKATDPAPYNKTGAWSSWCQFLLDTAAPTVSVSIVAAPAGPGMPGTFRIESPATDVTKFRYGWIGASTEVAAQGTGPKYVQVTLTAPKYGRNTLYVAAVDATALVGNGSKDFTVPRPAPAVARWGMETYPGVTTTQALADGNSSVGGDTPLTATDLAWADGVRMIGGKTASFNGTTSLLAAPTAVVDTSGSFSVAAWVKTEPLSGCGSQDVASVDDPDSAFSPFVLGFSCWTGKWWFRLSDREVGTAVYTDALSANTAMVSRWTHLAGVWDEPEQKVKLYVDGTLSASVTPSGTWLATRGAGWTANGPFVLSKGRAYGYYGDPFKGEIADMQVFNRALVDHDFTGQLASDPYSGGVNEPGIVAPVEVGRWDFSTAAPCYLQDLENTCEAADGGAWGRWLAFTQGADLMAGPDGGAAMELDACYFPEDPASCTATTEYGRTAFKVGVNQSDPANPKTMWQNTPVLRTDQSFTVSAWVLPRDASVNRAVASQVGVHESAFLLQWDQGAGNRWSFFVTDEDNSTAAQVGVTSAVVTPTDSAWTHLVGVYDASRSELRLYVDSVRVGTRSLTFVPMASTGSLQIGRTLYHDGYGRYWNGGVDDVLTYQGAMTDAAVAQLYATQSTG